MRGWRRQIQQKTIKRFGIMRAGTIDVKLLAQRGSTHPRNEEKGRQEKNVLNEEMPATILQVYT
jgi:hypothetical protein